MERNKIVQKLIAEGFSPETLVNMGDKQLNFLSTTVLSEQLDGMAHVSKTDPNKDKIVSDLKVKGKSFEVSEVENVQSGQQPGEVTTIGYGKSMDISVAKQMAIADAKRQGLGGNGFANITNLRVIKEKKQQNPDGSYYYAVQCTMTVNKPNASRDQRVDVTTTQMSLGNQMNEWVENLVKENYHMVATKGDITSMVSEKLMEQSGPIIGGDNMLKKVTGIDISSPNIFPGYKAPAVATPPKPAVKPTPQPKKQVSGVLAPTDPTVLDPRLSPKPAPVRDKKLETIRWQNSLKKQGFDVGVVDGVWGPKTQAAYLAWKKRHDTSRQNSMNDINKKIFSPINQSILEAQNPFEKMTLPEDTEECVYADGVSKDQSLAQKIANSNARNKFKGKFPTQISIKNIETAHRTPDGNYRYVVGLKVRNEAGAQGEVDEPFVKDTNKGELQEQPTMVRKPKVTSNALPEWLSFDSIKSAQPDIATPKTKPGTITKPGERVRPRTPYQPGPGVNPNPKAKY